MARASFSTLPLELKARIVEMTSNQEDAWWLRVRKNEHAGHISSLSSLALVNKELRALAAKHQFKRLSSRKASRPVFRFTIFPRYGHHITEVKLTGNNESQLDDVLAIMSQLPALCSLLFWHEAAMTLFGPAIALPAVALPAVPSEETDAGPYRADMLEQISPQIAQLSLVGFDHSTSVALVQRFGNLRTLIFQNLHEAESEEEIKVLTGAIATRRHLTHLTVHLASNTMTGWPTEAFGPLGSNPLPLQTLQLLWFPLDHHTLNLIGLFGSTLETLSLDLWAPSPAPDLSSRDPLQLPQLASLNLTLSKKVQDIQGAIRIILPSPNLSSLSFSRSTSGLMDPTMPALVAALDSQSNIRRVQFGGSFIEYPVTKLPPSKDLATPSSLAAYADMIHSRGLDPRVLDKPHLTPFHPEAKFDYTENEAGYLEEVLGRTLDFGRIELKRMVAEGNVASAVEWVEMLKPLEDKRLAWKD